MVYIWEQNYAGSVTTLTGAAEPFITQEDATDDIFTPIRQQTGTLRIIDETGDGSLLEMLTPQNNTQNLVQLYSGTWSGDTFTDGNIHWMGFLCAEAFTQPWDRNKKVIEIPVQSVLAALQDVQIPNTYASLEDNIATLLRYAIESLSITLSGVYTISDLSINLPQVEQFFKNCINWSVFFNEETVLDQAESVKVLVGMSYQKALAIVAQLYGLSFREKGDKLIICQYDDVGQIISVTPYSWQNIIEMSSGIFPTIAHSALQSVDMLTSLTFQGNNNIAEFRQGRKSASVTLNLGGITLNIELPQTAEDTSTVISVSYIVDGQVWCQPHEPRSLGIERYTFKQISCTPTGSPNIYYVYALVGDGSYAQCLDNSVLYHPGYSTPPGSLYSGAFPCRWFHKATEDNSAINLKNGLFLNQESVESGRDSADIYEAYSIKSSLEFNVSNGYLNIDMQQHSFIHGYRQAQYHWDFDNIPTEDGLQLTMKVALKIGNMYWNGSNWTSTPSIFNLPFKNTAIISNKVAGMNVEGTSGWFIPVTGHMSGVVELIIYNAVIVEPYATNRSRLEAHSRIISDLKVEFFMNNSKTASHRTQNTYRQTILASGFADTENRDLQLGTINNNIYWPCFIENAAKSFIENFDYLLTRTQGGITSKSQRPELHLLDRMVSHYGQIRRSFIGIVKTGNDLTLQRFSLSSRNYFGIDKQHNWRDDTQEVKFIEVS